MNFAKNFPKALIGNKKTYFRIGATLVIQDSPKSW